jgi:hypothetical protein
LTAFRDQREWQENGDSFNWVSKFSTSQSFEGLHEACEFKHDHTQGLNRSSTNDQLASILDDNLQEAKNTFSHPHLTEEADEEKHGVHEISRQVIIWASDGGGLGRLRI